MELPEAVWKLLFAPLAWSGKHWLQAMKLAQGSVECEPYNNCMLGSPAGKHCPTCLFSRRVVETSKQAAGEAAYAEAV